MPGLTSVTNVRNGTAMASDEIIGVVGGISATPRVTITRPADTNIYAAGDAFNNSTGAPTVPVVTVGRIVAGTGLFTGMKAVDSAAQATKLGIQVLLFDTTFTALEDNAAIDMSDAEALRLVAIFEVGTSDWIATNATGGAGGNCVAQVGPVGNGHPGFVCLAGSQSLYVVVRVTNAYTPVSEEVLTLIFDIQQD